MSGFFIFNYKNKVSAGHSSVIDYEIGRKRMRVGTNINVGTKLREMIVWYEQKKSEEQQLAQLCKEYPNLAEAKREFDSIYNLVKEHK